MDEKRTGVVVVVVVPYLCFAGCAASMSIGFAPGGGAPSSAFPLQPFCFHRRRRRLVQLS